MKKSLLSLAAVALSVIIAGCSTAQQGVETNGSADSVQADAPKLAADEIAVDDVAWSVEPGVDGGNRRMMFTFTNESEYDIAGFELDFKVKEDTTSEELMTAFSKYFEDGTTEEELREATMRATSTAIVRAGDTSASKACSLLGWYLESAEQYQLLDPDILTIQFVHNDKLYEEYYDYHNDSYSLSQEVIDTKQWSDSELASALPRPENELVVDAYDSDNSFSFSTMGTTQEGVCVNDNLP